MTRKPGRLFLAGDYGFYVSGPAGAPELEESEQGKADAALIAHAPTDLRALLDEVARLTEEVEMGRRRERSAGEAHGRVLAAGGERGVRRRNRYKLCFRALVSFLWLLVLGQLSWRQVARGTRRLAAECGFEMLDPASAARGGE